MEVTTKRVVIVSLILLAFGVASQLRPQAATDRMTEGQVEALLPTSLGVFRMEPSESGVRDSAVTYKGSAEDYRELNPFGMVGRVFTDGNKQYDTMAVVGNDRDTFHDPNFCMAGHYYNIENEHVVTLATQSRGSIPLTVMTVEDKDGKRLVAFCYLGPHGIHPTQDTLYSDWFWTELQLGKPRIGAFYRFMSMSGSDTEENLLQFARMYLDAAKSISGGLL